jgi:hypothetical protein
MLAGFYERDLRKMIDEINLFNDEENLWKTVGSTKNSCGNLALHIAGGLNHFVGATLAKTGYVRNRDLEFSDKGVPRKEIVARLEELIPVVKKTVGELSEEQLNAEFPIFYDKPGTTTGYVLTQLSLHLNYHLGQVNYLRRVLE